MKLNYEFVIKDMIEDGIIDNDIFEMEFKKASNGKSTLTLDSFETFINNLEPYSEGDDMEVDDTNDDDNNDNDDDEEEISIEDAFDEISGGKKTATLKDVASWDLVSEMIEDGVIDKKTFEEEFKKAQ